MKGVCDAAVIGRNSVKKYALHRIYIEIFINGENAKIILASSESLTRNLFEPQFRCADSVRTSHCIDVIVMIVMRSITKSPTSDL